MALEVVDEADVVVVDEELEELEEDELDDESKVWSPEPETDETEVGSLGGSSELRTASPRPPLSS